MRSDKGANISLQSREKILQLKLEPMSSQSLLVNLQVRYFPSVVRLFPLYKPLLPAGQCNFLLNLNSWNNFFFAYFLFFVVPKDLFRAQTSQHGCISNRQVSTENYQNEDLETRWQWCLLTFFRNKLTVQEKAFISALRNTFSSVVTHPFFVN